MVIVDVAGEEASGVIGGATGIHADDSRPVAAGRLNRTTEKVAQGKNAASGSGASYSRA
jgi:hypothetical protein